MKTTAAFRLSLCLGLLSFPLLAPAQLRPVVPVGVGYWNIESNLACPARVTVRFYNGQHQLLHAEQAVGRRFIIRRNRIQLRTINELNVALQHVLREPQLVAGATVLARPQQPARRS